ncbi:ABC transporter substrate-binding protein [Alteromonas sp. A079]|uniref:ABC transporter substrate-binding protein n=1 Tax=Alteromonas sp. A079 TaxID=3410268 RepID=UPI003B9F1E1F
MSRLLLFYFASALFIASSSAQAEPSPFIIGVDADLSSFAIDGGKAIQRGVQLAVDEINNSGGLLGRQVIVKSRDHRGNPARGVHNITQFSSMKNLLAIVGGVHTPVVMAELEAIHKNNVLMLVPWAAGTPIIDNGYSPNNIFRVSVRDAEAGKVLMKHAKEKGVSRVALVLERTAWGRSNDRSLTEAAAQLGITVASKHWINWQQNAFADDITRLKTQDAQAVIMVTNVPEGAVVVNELIRQKLSSLPVISHWGIASGDFVKRLTLPAEKLDIAVLQTFHFNRQPTSKSKALRKKYSAKYGSSLNEDIPAAVGIAHAYDIVSMLAAAVKKANSSDVNTVRSTLETMAHHDGAVKFYSPAFTANQHDALFAPDYFMATFNNDGHITTMETGR